MDIVTIRAGHALFEHFTLQEETQHENFVVDLAIAEIKARVQQRQAVLVVVGDRGFGVADRRSSRITAAAGIDEIVAPFYLG